MNERKKPLFFGAATALITPMKDGTLDLDTWEKLIDFQCNEGISGLIVCGTTGESSTLSDTEKDTLLCHAVDRVNGKVPVLMGTGSNDTSKAITSSKRAAEEGADALLVVTPYYNKGTKHGIRTHFLKIAEAAKVPVFLYNVPSRTGVDLTEEDYEMLCAHPNIIGVKEAGGGVERAAWLCRTLSGRCGIYTGNDGWLLPYLSFGADGVISVLSNIFPKEVGEICHLYRSGKTAAAAEQGCRMMKLIGLLFSQTSPAPVKYAMSYLGFGSGEMRLPMTPVDAATAAALRREIGHLRGAKTAEKQ